MIIFSSEELCLFNVLIFIPNHVTDLGLELYVWLRFCFC